MLPRKKKTLEVETAMERSKAAWGSEDWLTRIHTPAGVQRWHGSKGVSATGEAFLVPARNGWSQVDRITGSTGKSVEDEKVAEGSVVAVKRSNARGAKGPYYPQRLGQHGEAGTR